MDGTGGGSENRKHQKLATYSQETCAELARKPQEEGFTGGLPAHNMPGIRTTACPASVRCVSRIVAVDNLWITLWITMGFIHTPAIAHKRPMPGFWAFRPPYHTHAHVRRLWRDCAPLPGIAYGQKTPANDRRRKTPRNNPWGWDGTSD